MACVEEEEPGCEYSSTNEMHFHEGSCSAQCWLALRNLGINSFHFYLKVG